MVSAVRTAQVRVSAARMWDIVLDWKKEANTLNLPVSGKYKVAALQKMMPLLLEGTCKNVPCGKFMKDKLRFASAGTELSV